MFSVSYHKYRTAPHISESLFKRKLIYQFKLVCVMRDNKHILYALVCVMLTIKKRHVNLSYSHSAPAECLTLRLLCTFENSLNHLKNYNYY